MFESADSKSLLAESLAAHGYSDESVQAVISHYGKMAELEMMVDKADWPFPTYGDLMFEV